MLKVIYPFTDLQDNRYVYNVGDEYPRQGTRPTKSRISELLSDNNLQHKPLLAVIDEDNEIVDNEDVKPAKKKRGKRNENN